MADYADFFPTLALSAALLLAALAAARVLELTRLPSPAAFLAVGAAAGLLGIAPTDQLSTVTLEQVGAVALFLILFKGGLDTGFTAWRASSRPILALSIPGTALTALGLALVGRLILGLDWSVAILIGVGLAPTDPAAVYAVLRGRRGLERPRTILEGESGFNDPAAISLMVAVTTVAAGSDSSYGDAAVRFVQEFAVGTATGIAGGLLLIVALRATPHLEQGVQAIFVILAALMLGGLTATVDGSGFLAVYLAGLVLSDAWAKQDEMVHAVPEALGAISEPLLFALLGAAFAPLVGPGDVARGIVLTVATVLVVRPIVAASCLTGSGLSRAERALVSWGGLKGAVPLLLAAYPALEGFGEADTVAATVLVATAVSLVLQGVLLPRLAGIAATPPTVRTPA
ncbi:MAG: potassium/hydrogen antiporter [Gaiellales bacterium]|jgi:cell volume regulation protein A|nr:potassium/hydrogen antiporter [Gaiellales bacterium]